MRSSVDQRPEAFRLDRGEPFSSPFRCLIVFKNRGFSLMFRETSVFLCSAGERRFPFLLPDDVVFF